MNKEEFAAFMAARGATGDGTTYSGTFQNYPFAVTYFGGKANTTNFNLRFSLSGPVKQMYKPITSTFDKKQAVIYPGTLLPGGYGAAGIQLTKETFAVTVAVKKNQPPEAIFDRLVALITSTAAQMGLTPPQVCAVCGQPATDAFALHKDAYAPVHTACIQNQVATTYNKAVQNQQNGNYALGVVGALLGAIVGAAPSILLMVFINIISAWLCALIPLGAYFGYKLFRGKLTGVATVIVIIVSVIMIPVMSYFTEAFNFQEQLGVWLTVSLYTEYLFSDFGALVPGYLQLLLFVGLGVLITWGLITAGNKQAIAAANAQANSVRSAGAQPAMQAPTQQPYMQHAATSTVPADMRDEAPRPAAEPPKGPEF